MAGQELPQQEQYYSDIEKIYEVLHGLQKGSFQSIVTIAVGLLATLGSLFATTYYFLGVYSNISQAKAELRRSENTVTVARERLAAVRVALNRIQSTPSQAATSDIRDALFQVSAGEIALHDISFSIKGASGLLPFDAANDPSANRWFTVIESYDDTKNGIARATARMQQIDALGKCVEIWRTKTNTVNLVTLDGATDKLSASLAADRAKSEGLSSSAYAFQSLHGDWTLVSTSTNCP